MLTPGLLQRQVETLQRAEREWRERHQGRTATKMITIALAREAGAPGTSVAIEVGKRLNWLVYDHQLVEKIAQEMGLRTQLLESVDEKSKSWLLESVEGFTSAGGVSEISYVRHLTQTIFSLAAHGNCVIVGRGAAHLLPRATTLRVRLIGVLEDRIAAVSRRLGVSKEKAAQWVSETDRQRRAFVQDFFLKDPTDPHYYDLLLNTSTWTVADCADLVLHGLRELEQRTS